MSEKDTIKSKKEHSKINDEITVDINFKKIIKKHYVIILILLFIVIGFNLRAYQIDHTPIGYHNAKENQYLPYAQFMYNADEWQDYFRTETFWGGSREKGYFTEYEFPFLPWSILIIWKLFGVKVWLARLIIIISSLACIPAIYMLTKELTKNVIEKGGQEFIGLTAALLFTIMPLAIFFGRNIQPESPALLAILIYTIFFIKWRDAYISKKPHTKLFFFFTLTTLVAILFKIPYGIGLVPLLFFVPWKTFMKDKKTLLKLATIFFIIIIILPVWSNFSKKMMPNAHTVGTANFGQSLAMVKMNFDHVIDGGLYREGRGIIRSFIIDNFTLNYVYLMLLGILCVFIHFYLTKKKRKNNQDLFKFTIGSITGIIIYVLMFSTKVKGHSYYQMPFIFFLVLMCAFAIWSIGKGISTPKIVINKKAFHIKYVAIILLIALLFFTYPQLEESKNRQFNTVFFGEDLAGDFIKQNSLEDERVLLAGVGTQNVGILWSAQRYGTHYHLKNLTKIKEMEDTLNFKWIVLYRDGIGSMQQDKEIWEHITTNYGVRQVGGIAPDAQNFNIIYITLEKGKTGTIEDLQQIVPVKAKTYELTNNKVNFYTITK
jgi:hypothetical protein